MGFLISFVNNDEIRPSISCQIINSSMTRGKKSTRFLGEQLVICSSAFWKQKWENVKNISLTFFKFQSNSIPAHSVPGQRHLSTVLLYWGDNL